MGEAGDGRRRSGAPLGAVLAGGRGSRIGGAKALVELAGRPLISYPLAAVEAAGLEPVVVAKPDSELPPLRCRVIREPAGPRHPLCGIVAALRRAGGRPLVAVGCDMPFAAPLLAPLAAAPEPLVAASIGDRLQPLPARYSDALLPALEAALREERALRPTLESLRPRTIAETELARLGDPRRLCLNVNTAADLARAERMLAAAADAVCAAGLRPRRCARRSRAAR
jgi:molybdopterin-guanine dinucleotide biosynthesis protein A